MEDNKYALYSTLFAQYRFEEYSPINEDEFTYRGNRAFASYDMRGIVYDLFKDKYRVYAYRKLKNGKTSQTLKGEFYDIIEAIIVFDEKSHKEYRYVVDGKLTHPPTTINRFDRFVKKFVDTYKYKLDHKHIARMLGISTDIVKRAMYDKYGSIDNPTVVVWDIRANYDNMAEELVKLDDISDAFIDDFIGVNSGS